MKRKILLFSERVEDKLFCQSMAETMECVCETTDNLGEFIDKLSKDDFYHVFMDASIESKFKELENALADRFGLVSDKPNTNFLHYISSEDLEKVPYLVESHLFGNFIFRKFKSKPSIELASERYSTVLKAVSKDRHISLKDLGGKGTQIQSLKLKKASQKHAVLNALQNYLAKSSFNQRVSNIISNAADELIMNAVFAAPVDELGVHTLDAAPRDSEVILSGKSEVEFNILYDGKTLGLSALDQFGSINKEKVTQHLSIVYKDKKYVPKYVSAGAGIGLSTVFRSGASLVFIGEKSSRTEVIALFEKKATYKAFHDQFRFILNQFFF